MRSSDLDHESRDGFGGTRGFCPHCGSHITFIGDGRPDQIDITIGTPDDPNRFPPVEDAFAEQKVSWMRTFAK